MAQTCCTPLTSLLMVIVIKQGKLNRKLLLYAFLVLSSGLKVYRVSVPELWQYFILKHIWHSILTPPSFQDWLLTPIWIESNEFSSINWWIIGLQNCLNEIAKIFDPRQNRKNLLYEFLFRKTCMQFFLLLGICPNYHSDDKELAIMF